MNLKPEKIDRTSLTLVWAEPEDDGGTPITGYVVERREATRCGIEYITY